MSNSKINSIFFNSFKTMLASLFKLLFIAFSWLLKLFGMVCMKLGEAIERIIVKRSSL